MYGTALAVSGRVSARAPALQRYECHWDYVPGPHRNGAATRLMVWICEYPYRTIRADGPCAECVCGHADEACASSDAAVEQPAAAQPQPAAQSRVLPFRETR